MSEPLKKTSLNQGQCLLIEDHEETLEHIKNAITQNFPLVSIVVMKSVAETQKWLNERTSLSEKINFALIDLGLPDGSGIEIIKQLSRRESHCINVVVSNHSDDGHLFDALAAGAYGYILKDEDHAHLINTLKRIESNEPPLSPAIAHRLISHFRNPGIIPNNHTDLTPRETETLTLIARGLTVSESAEKMGLSSQTVAGYVKNIYQKLHLTNRAEATREAIRRGLT